jgi:hypothetical protein
MPVPASNTAIKVSTKPSATRCIGATVAATAGDAAVRFARCRRERSVDDSGLTLAATALFLGLIRLSRWTSSPAPPRPPPSVGFFVSSIGSCAGARARRLPLAISADGDTDAPFAEADERRPFICLDDAAAGGGGKAVQSAPLQKAQNSMVVVAIDRLRPCFLANLALTLFSL